MSVTRLDFSDRYEIQDKEDGDYVAYWDYLLEIGEKNKELEAKDKLITDLMLAFSEIRDNLDGDVESICDFALDLGRNKEGD